MGLVHVVMTKEKYYVTHFSRQVDSMFSHQPQHKAQGLQPSWDCCLTDSQYPQQAYSIQGIQERL